MVYAVIASLPSSYLVLLSIGYRRRSICFSFLNFYVPFLCSYLHCSSTLLSTSWFYFFFDKPISTNGLLFLFIGGSHCQPFSQVLYLLPSLLILNTHYVYCSFPMIPFLYVHSFILSDGFVSYFAFSATINKISVCATYASVAIDCLRSFLIISLHHTRACFCSTNANLYSICIFVHSIVRSASHASFSNE